MVMGRRDGSIVAAFVIVACVEEWRGAPRVFVRAVPVNSEHYSDSERRSANRPRLEFRKTVGLSQGRYRAAWILIARRSIQRATCRAVGLSVWLISNKRLCRHYESVFSGRVWPRK
jgi:hypothetical protein